MMRDAAVNTIAAYDNNTLQAAKKQGKWEYEDAQWHAVRVRNSSNADHKRPGADIFCVSLC